MEYSFCRGVSKFGILQSMVLASSLHADGVMVGGYSPCSWLSAEIQESGGGVCLLFLELPPSLRASVNGGSGSLCLAMDMQTEETGLLKPAIKSIR